ncbi:unnamed protein product [Paramecium primaurelia]|uniref:RING-type domain-containing protein n=2 Tax=Paramecium TaxID=5884 RepID=A0A8S1NAC1_PARPR|nr:unnamed protein product [Paramecium primaurelia]
MDEQKQNKIILKILVKQALIQQYLININVCCLLNDYFYTIALNGLAIIFIAFVYHIIPLKSSKIKYIVEYSLLAGVQILAIFMKELLIYLASSLLGLSILSVLFKICRTQLNVDQSLGLFKLCVGMLKCFLSLQLLFLSLHLNSVLPWSWMQIFVILWFILVCGLLFQICMILNLLYKTLKRLNYSIERRNSTNIKYYGGIWYTIQLHCLTFNPFFTLLNFCLTMDQNFTMIYLPIMCITGWMIMMIVSFIIRKEQINNMIPQVGTSENEVFMNEGIPKYLMKISSTYFQQTDKPFEILSTSPRKSNDAEMKCLICFENESGYVLMNCGHGGLCLKCASNLLLKNKECYLCRQPIMKVFQIQKNNFNFVEVIGIIETQ